jgi:hypothetical protein
MPLTPRPNAARAPRGGAPRHARPKRPAAETGKRRHQLRLPVRGTRKLIRVPTILI